MNNYIIILFTAFGLFIISCSSFVQSSQLETPQTDIELIKYEDLFSKIQSDKYSFYVVNFWATWCKPCVEEMPGFMEVNSNFSGNKDFKMYLVSMDFEKNLRSHVIPFLAENNIRAEVLLMNDNKRMDTWIPLIDERWSGSIPATLIYKNGKKIYFKEGTLTKDELTEIITKNL